MSRMIIALSLVLVGSLARTATGEAKAEVTPPVKAAGIVGKWKTFDEKTGKPKGLVEILADGAEYKGILRDTTSTNVVCKACTGDKKDQPLRGLAMISGVTAKGPDEWGGGEILDPENGKTYRVKFALLENGQKLKVRGYIGISLLGRTQVWERAPLETATNP